MDNLRSAELDAEAHFIGSADVDGKVFTSSGVSLGNRTEIGLQVAGKYLALGSATALRRTGPGDFADVPTSATQRPTDSSQSPAKTASRKDHS